MSPFDPLRYCCYPSTLHSMFVTTLLLTWLTVLAQSTCAPAPGPSFQGATLSTTAAGALCLSGNIPVSVNATNTALSISPDLSQRNLTEVLQELLQVNSTIAARSALGPSPVIDTFSIAATLCVPPEGVEPKGVVEILSHGLGLSQAYWDTAPENSYVDAAAQAGYSTLRYDRLGVGHSAKPDPINVVQFTTHVEILHGIAQLVRQGEMVSNFNYTKVVGVGHSVGSIIQIGATGKYPADFDAVVITGCSDTLEYLPYTALSTTPARAKDDPSGVYATLPGSYVIDPSPIGFQQAFFRYPYFEESVFDTTFATRSTNTVGDFFTLGAVFAPATTYTGPVSVVDGQQDFSFCLGNCLVPYNRAQALLTTFFPAASSKSETYLVPDTGHLINDHENAGLAFQNTNSFLDNAFA